VKKARLTNAGNKDPGRSGDGGHTRTVGGGDQQPVGTVRQGATYMNVKREKSTNWGGGVVYLRTTPGVREKHLESELESWRASITRLWCGTISGVREPLTYQRKQRRSLLTTRGNQRKARELQMVVVKTERQQLARTERKKGKRTRWVKPVCVLAKACGQNVEAV